MYCEYGHGRCIAPDTKCIHWMGIFCELDAPIVVKKYHKCIYKTDRRLNKNK